MEQEVILRMIAELDQGNIKSDVAQLAQGMSREFEAVFQKMGENIVQVIANNLARGVKDVVRGFETGRPSALGGAAAGLVDPHGRPVTSMTQPTAGERVAETKPYGLQDFRGGYADPYRSSGTAAARFVGDLFKNRQGFDVDEGLLDPRKAAFQDSMAMKARMYQAQEKAGLPVALGEGEMKGMETAREQITRSLMDLPKHFDLLAKELEDSTREIKSLSEEIEHLDVNDPAALAAHSKLKTEDEKSGLIREQMSHLTDVQMGMTSQMSAINGALSAGRGPSGMQRFAGMAGAAGTLLSSLAEIPGGIRASQMGFAETENLGGRAAMRGDIDRMMAMRMAGGEGALRAQGTLEAGLGVAGNIAGTLGSAAATLIPGMEGVGAMGAATFGARTVSGIANFGQARQSAINSMLEKQMGVNAEAFRSMSAGRDFETGVTQFGRSTGMYEYGDFLRGGLGNEVGTGRFTLSGMGAPGASQQYDRGQAERLSKMYGYKMNEIQGPNTGGLYGTGKDYLGMDTSETQQFLASMAGTAGGVFQGKRPMLAQQNVQGDIETLMKNISQGGIGADKFAAAATRQGDGIETFKRMVQGSSDILKEIVGGGFDKSEMPRIFEKMAAESGAGAGAGDIALQKERLALELARDTAGGNTPGSGAAMRRGESIVEDVSHRSFDPNDMMSSFFQVGLQKAAKKDPVLAKILSGNIGEQQAFMRTEQTPQSIAAMFKRHGGGDLTAEQAQAEFEKFQSVRLSAARQVQKSAPTYAANMALNEVGIGGSGMELVERLNMIDKLGVGTGKKAVGPVMGPDVPAEKISEKGPGGALMAQNALQSIVQVSGGMGTLNTQIGELIKGIAQYTETLRLQKEKLGTTGSPMAPPAPMSILEKLKGYPERQTRATPSQ